VYPVVDSFTYVKYVSERCGWDLGRHPRSWSPTAVTYNVHRLFLAVSAHVDDSAHLAERARWQQTITLAHGANIFIEALGGDSGWLDQGTGPFHTAIGLGAWDGIYLDIEPYTTPAWVTDQAGTINTFIRLLSSFVTTAGPPLPVEADVSFFYNLFPAGPAGPSLDVAVLTCVNSVAIMTYRNIADGPDGTIALADSALAAAQAGKPASGRRPTT